MWPPVHSSAAPAEAQASLLQAVLAGLGFFCFYQHTSSGTVHSALSWFWGASAAHYIFSQLHPASWLLLTRPSHVPVPEVLQEPSEEGERVPTTQVTPAYLSALLNPSQSFLFSPARPLPHLHLARNRVTGWE